jgi:hypothetical protein
MATTPPRNAGRQKTCFYINRERPTSAVGAGPRAHIDFAHCVRVPKAASRADWSW